MGENIEETKPDTAAIFYRVCGCVGSLPHSPNAGWKPDPLNRGSSFWSCDLALYPYCSCLHRARWWRLDNHLTHSSCPGPNFRYRHPALVQGLQSSQSASKALLLSNFSCVASVGCSHRQLKYCLVCHHQQLCYVCLGQHPHYNPHPTHVARNMRRP